MQLYEAMVVLKPQASEAEITQFIEKSKEFITSCSGQIISEEKLGRKKLCYEVKKNRDGFYAYIKFRAGCDVPAKLNNQLKLNEMVIRSMVVKSVEPKKTVTKK